MPSWLVVYLALFAVLVAVSIAGDLRRSGARWLLAETSAALCLVLVALAYWMPVLRELFAPVALPMFLVGLTSIALAGARSFAGYRARHRLSGHVHVAAALSGGLGMLLAAGPLVYWAFEVAVRGNFAPE